MSKYAKMVSKGSFNFNPLPHSDAFDTFANRTDPDQAAIVAYEKMIRYDTLLVDLTCYFFV